jgi:hypothetical protein
MNDFDLLGAAARQRTSNGRRRPARRLIAYTLTSNLFTVPPVSLVARPMSAARIMERGFTAWDWGVSYKGPTWDGFHAFAVRSQGGGAGTST